MATRDKSEWPVWGAVGAALAASACCTVPLVLVSLGIGGAWMSGLTALEPYREVFMMLAVGMLGFAFVRSYRARSAPDCEPGACDTGMRPRTRNLLLGLGGVATLALIASPWLLPSVPSVAMNAQAPFTDADAATVAEAHFNIDGMTCASCTTTVAVALRRTEGVHAAEVTYEPPRAVVRYDPAYVTPEALATIITHTGYPATPTRHP